MGNPGNPPKIEQVFRGIAQRRHPDVDEELAALGIPEVDEPGSRRQDFLQTAGQSGDILLGGAQLLG